MNKWLKGLVVVLISVFIIGGTGCSRQRGDEPSQTSTSVPETGVPSELTEGLLENLTSEKDNTEPDPSTVQKTEEPLAADEEEFAKLDQLTQVKSIDQSLIKVLTQFNVLFALFEKTDENRVFTADKLDQIATKADLINDSIYQTEEQMEVYYYLYGTDQNEFISFLYTVEDDLDAELFKLVTLADLIRNSEIAAEDISATIMYSVSDMKIQVENLKLKQEKFVNTFEMNQ
jgi:hypothetical protein